MNDRVMLETIQDLGPHAEIAHEVLTVRLPRLMQDVMHVYLVTVESARLMSLAIC